VRDLSRTRFPRLKAMPAADFREQVQELSECYEMCRLEVALAYLAGKYQPKKPLCLLTFDDGFKDHYDVTAELSARRIPGVFFLITDCVANQRVAPVHMNHFLTASLAFEDYRAEFLERVGPAVSTLGRVLTPVARRTYVWDDEPTAVFKYFFNFLLEPEVRDATIEQMFEEHIGSQEEFASSLYVNWEEARQMQREGMVIGGHTHSHRPCASLTDAQLKEDLELCRWHLATNLNAQPLWPFSYPYGKADTYDQRTVAELQRLGFDCSFSTETGLNQPGNGRYSIRRVDCKVATASRRAA
jgi:peptidoglycan/xylan/chitin deacetylase (PgdA/CDA1 family)